MESSSIRSAIQQFQSNLRHFSRKELIGIYVFFWKRSIDMQYFVKVLDPVSLMSGIRFKNWHVYISYKARFPRQFTSM